MIMKKIFILFLLLFCYSAYPQDDFGSVRVNELYFGSSYDNYDIKVYRSAADILKTDDNFEILGYLKYKTIQLTASGDSIIIIDKATDDSVATRKWVRENINSSVHWDNVTNKPSRITNYTASNLMLRDNLIEEVTTAADNGAIWINYAGHESGTGYYRDFNIGNGKNSAIVVVDGSAGTTTFNGNVSLGSNDLSLDDITSVDDISADFVQSNTATIGNLTITGTIVSSTGVDVDIRPATGNFALNYTKTGDLNFYNNTTPVFSLQETGAGYFASTVDATAYKVNGSAGTSGQAIVSNGTTGGVWATIPALTDGDKGDITVSSSGTVWTVDNDAVTFAKIQNITDNKLLGRSAGSSGDMQEITIGTGLSLSGGTLTASASAPAFNQITTGSNTTATMTVGAGGVLSYTSTGVVNANQFQGVTTVDATEFGYLNGVTSAIQTQLDNNKAFSAITNGTSTGKNLLVGNSTVFDYTGTGVINASHLGGTAASGYYLASNPSGYITSSALSGYATQAWVTSAINAAIAAQPNVTIYYKDHSGTNQEIDVVVP
jgi:hypothetical protein